MKNVSLEVITFAFFKINVISSSCSTVRYPSVQIKQYIYIYEITYISLSLFLSLVPFPRVESEMGDVCRDKNRFPVRNNPWSDWSRDGKYRSRLDPLSFTNRGNRTKIGRKAVFRESDRVVSESAVNSWSVDSGGTTTAAAAETVASIASLLDGWTIDGSVWLRALVSRDKWRGKQSCSRTSEPFSPVVAIFRRIFIRKLVETSNHRNRVDTTIKLFVSIFDRSFVY